jgi:hypothetical protein
MYEGNVIATALFRQIATPAGTCRQYKLEARVQSRTPVDISVRYTNCTDLSVHPNEAMSLIEENIIGAPGEFTTYVCSTSVPRVINDQYNISVTDIGICGEIPPPPPPSRIPPPPPSATPAPIQRFSVSVSDGEGGRTLFTYFDATTNQPVTTTSAIVPFGTQISVFSNATAGYEFTELLTGNGGFLTQLPQSSYAITSNREFIAQYRSTVIDVPQLYSVSVADVLGTSGNSFFTYFDKQTNQPVTTKYAKVPFGTIITVTSIPNAGYKFAELNNGNTSQTLTNNTQSSYTITENLNLTAFYDEIVGPSPTPSPTPLLNNRPPTPSATPEALPPDLPHPSPSRSPLPSSTPRPSRSIITWRDCISGDLIEGIAPAGYREVSYNGAGGGTCWQPTTQVGFSPTLSEALLFTYQRGSSDLPQPKTITATNPSYGTAYRITITTNTDIIVQPSSFTVTPRSSQQFVVNVTPTLLDKLGDGTSTIEMSVDITEI